MNKIFNEFVTIEYDNEKEEELAKYCMEILNMEEAFYKGLLNGIKVLKAKDLPKIDPDYAILCESDEDREIYEQYYREIYVSDLNKTIMKMNGIDDEEYQFYCIDYDYIYNYYILQILLEGYQISDFKQDYFELAYTYFKETNDFSYLTKIMYDKTANMNDLIEMCKYYIDNHYEELLIEKIKLDIETLEQSKLITNDALDIIEIVEDVTKNIEAFSKELYTDYKNSNNTITIPEITDQEFEKLVKEALVYIDPTNNLLEEYLKCKDEGRIQIIENQPYDGSAFYYSKNDYEIRLYKKGNLEDVISFVHEFSHLHYMTLDHDKTNNSRLFDEYFSIYYELKTAEFLEKKGYSKEIINFTKSFRAQNNSSAIPYLYTIFISYTNMGKNIEDYDLSNAKFLANHYNNLNEEEMLKKMRQLSVGTSEEELKNMLKIMIMQTKMSMLKPADDLIGVLKYTIGTFFAEYSINNLKHEDVLKILQDIKLNDKSLSEVLKMHGISSKKPDTGNQAENNKIKEKIDDKE